MPLFFREYSLTEVAATPAFSRGNRALDNINGAIVLIVYVSIIFSEHIIEFLVEGGGGGNNNPS